MFKFVKTAILLTALFLAATAIPAQEALKSTEEENENYSELKAMGGRNRTYKTFGVMADFFITKSFLASAEFDSIWVNYPYYNGKVGLSTFRVCLGLKYNI